MAKKLAAVGLRGKSGKRAGEHPDNDEQDVKAQDEDNDEQNVKAQDEDEEEETAKAKKAKAKKAQEEEDEKEAQDEEDFERRAQDEDEEETAKAKAVAQAKKSARLSAAAINDLCVLAGKPELAGGFIASGMSQAAVRRELLGARADGSSVGEIAGHTSPAGSPAATAAMWDHACKKNARFFGHA